jgi:hypothetical protein
MEQHLDRGEVLLDRRLLEFFSKPADIGSDAHRLDVSQFLDVVAPVALGEEAPAGMKIRRAGVRVVDGDGEEFQKAAHGLVAAGRDDRGHDRYPPGRRVSIAGGGPDSAGTSSRESLSDSVGIRVT